MLPDTSASGEAPSEMLLLLAGVRALHDEGAARQAAAQTKRVADWTRLRRAAEWHGLVPLLHKSLPEEGAGHVPVSERRALRQAFLVTAQHSLVLQEELLALLGAFEKAGIVAVPLKGPAFASWAYGNAAYRFSSDLDLLVPRSDLADARALLHALGYSSQWQHDAAGEAERVESQVGGEFFHPNGRVCVELHWSFLNVVHAFPLNPDAVRKRLVEVPFAGRTVPSLAPEDQLLYLCAHGSKHAWECLRWIADIDRLVRVCTDLDWTCMIEQAERLRCRRMVGVGLQLARGLLGLPLPAEINQQLMRDPAVPRLARQVQCALFSLEIPPMDERDKMRFHRAVREDLRDRLPYYGHMGRLAVRPSEKDHAFVALPDSMAFLYPLVRPLRLLKEGATQLMSSVAGTEVEAGKEGNS